MKALIGYITKGSDEEKTERGNVIISDVIQKKDEEKEKSLNHVAIDRFTGGAIDGALFSEKVIYGKPENSETFPYSITLKINKKAFLDKMVKPALIEVFKDITSGMLPLGGGVNRGHGVFTGKVYENGKLIIENGKKESHE